MYLNDKSFYLFFHKKMSNIAILFTFICFIAIIHQVNNNELFESWNLIRRKKKVYCKKTELLFEIQDKREVMIKTAKERGTIDEETIRLSQELDELIYKYQLVFRYEREKRKQIKRQYKNTRIFWSNASQYKRKNYSEVVYR